MRTVALTLAALTILAPRAAKPCSYDPCYYGSPRIGGIEAHSESPVPRDGAFVFVTDQEDSPTCLADLTPNLSIAVEHADEAVPGELVQLAGLPHVLIWRPQAQLVAGGTYAVEFVVDNDGLGPSEVDFSTCEPAQLVASFMFTVDDALAAAPMPPAPALTTESISLDTSLLGYACCPEVIPFYDDGSCFPEVYWDIDQPNGCGVVHGYTRLSIFADLPPLAETSGGQFAHQLIVDGELASVEFLGAFIGTSRRTATCARVERIHLGTGEIVASAETCPSPEVVAQLGPVALDPMLPCDDAQLCATDAYTWSDECAAYDPDLPPAPPPNWPYEAAFAPICPDASLFVDSGPPDDAPTTGASTEDGESTGDGMDAAGADDLPAEGRGCACTFGTGSSGGGLFLLLVIAGRRRRQVNGRSR
ncbi:hypothetical protein [Nannocystis sp.]|uniref:hypothetical protein n=1 Tax=Nannocystis sp. TaxID=1962667 RepID=UPI0025E210E0|nr:hypothetical protein [Nannocystis sp.]MBK7830748.1 hypothetical protein [Nannocystis sp.]